MPLPVFKDAKGKTKIAAQSEIVALSDQTFLMLARDSGNGQGLKGDTSLYREINIVDVSAATDIAGGAFDAADKPVAPKGVLDPSVTPAKLTPFIDINDKARARPLRPAQWRAERPRTTCRRSGKRCRWSACSIRSCPTTISCSSPTTTTSSPRTVSRSARPTRPTDGADVDTMFLVYQVTLPGLAKK